MQDVFSIFFQKYTAIVKEVDAVFENVRAAHPEAVACTLGCSDCCHALFDLPLIEAMYVNKCFNERFQGMARSAILDRASEADRQSYKLKRQIFKASEEGVPSSQLLEQVARMRVRCPLLNEHDQCDLYDVRPVTCRLYGVPTAFGGTAHTCGLSGFEEGKSYPTVNVDKLQDRLMLLSQELVDNLKTRHTSLAEILVPVSMALLNNYDEEYLGIIKDEGACAGCDSSHTWALGVTDEESAETAEEGCAGCAVSGSCAQCGSGQCPGDAPPKGDA